MPVYQLGRSFEEYDRAQEGNRAICPMCRQSTLNKDGLLIVDILNEGGFSGAVDLGDIFDRDRWEEQQPEEWRKGQALLSLCQMGDLEDAEELLKEDGVDPNAAYEDGTTGLHMAALNNAVEWASLRQSSIFFNLVPHLTGDLILLLSVLRYGANKQLQTDEGKTALDYALSADAHAVAELLRT